MRSSGALQEVTEFFHRHRCELIEVFRDQKLARLTYAWYAEGISRVTTGTNCAERLSWSFEKLVDQKEAVAFNDLSELPPDAAPDLPAYAAMGYVPPSRFRCSRETRLAIS